MTRFARRLLPWCALYGGIFGLSVVMAANPASGYFRIGESRLDVRHAIAVMVEPNDNPDDRQTLIYLSAQPLDAARAAAAFDADDGVREQEPDGGYVRICLDASGEDCGLFYSPEGFNSGGYGELALEAGDARRVAGRYHLDQPEEFFGKDYQFDLRFDAPVTPAPGTALPAGGAAPGQAYNAYLAALAKGDLPALRAMAGDEGRWRYPEDDATAAKEALKSARDGQPVVAEISRGRQHGDEAVLWVTGVDRDEIPRAGRVLMRKGPQGWVYEESDLDSVEEQ
ncbi:hypothetical protein [Agrilutibacter solisilvae]|uniref:Uncharacterized protein n=1 Tax=Agrilutibacter solisilvae TaxID=2763317 RepID=A0A975ATP7_9GAMM|nr:hypothetical protein [Lysobacter solisilvae]QSX79329.1 hypothetical protein I8J32_005515 [Lysobacter solisilvae]